MPTRAEIEVGSRRHPSIALLLCHCGKWAFRVDSHFPLFDPGPTAARPSAGCPIDWHVVPMAEPLPRTSMVTEKSARELCALSGSIHPDLVRTIHAGELLAYEPGAIAADEFRFYQ